MKLHKQIIRKFKRQKVYLTFRDSIWGADLADVQSLSKYNKGMKYLLCAIDLFSKYAWIVPLKNKRGISIVDVFSKKFRQFKLKTNKIWADQGGEFYNKLLKMFLKINNIEMYSTCNKVVAPVAERFISMLKNRIFKHMAAISKCLF